MQLNLGCLLLHWMFYTSLPALLLSRHNPFGEILVAVAAASMFALIIFLDFMIPMYMEAKVNKMRNISRPTGWLVSLNVLALAGLGATFVG